LASDWRATSSFASLMAMDVRALLEMLTTAGVEFIVIGGVAGQLLGSPVVTFDLDICYARDPENLARLARVLATIGARLRGAPADLPFHMDAQTLQNGDSFTFTTTLGDLDILGMPAGTRGYDDLTMLADRYDIDGLLVRVASLDDLIRMKQAAGRPKDLLALEELGALRDELDRTTGSE